MELWFSERHAKGQCSFPSGLTNSFFRGSSSFQRIDVFHSEEFGRFLTLDGYIMLTEKDEFSITR
jgi:spermidine synthase